jgi:hypothetical protein
MNQTFPLQFAEGASSLAPEKTSTGWLLQANGPLSARLTGFADAVICRAQAPDEWNRDVVQLGIGHVTSNLCNSVFSKAQDCAVEFEAAQLRLTPTEVDGVVQIEVSWVGPLVVTAYDDFMKLHRGLRYYQSLDRTQFPTAPAGWCSWYEYVFDINEEEIVRNTDWLKQNLQPFGCEWVQIDDGWQGRGEGNGGNRDWFVTSEKDFRAA